MEPKNHFIFLPPSQLFANLEFCVLIFFFKTNFIFNYLFPNPVKLVWEGSRNQ